MLSCWNGERHAAYEDARRRVGVTRESVWIQPTPMGDVAVIYLEADDLEVAFKAMGSSCCPAVRLLAGTTLLDVHGITLEEGFPPPEQILDFGATRA